MSDEDDSAIYMELPELKKNLHGDKFRLSSIERKDPEKSLPSARLSDTLTNNPGKSPGRDMATLVFM